MSDVTPTEIERALAWLIDNSEGVVGLKADGSLMPWTEVLSLYLPWWSGSFSDKELARVTGDITACTWCGCDVVDGFCVWCQPEDDAGGEA